MNWISVEDQMPENGDEVLVVNLNTTYYCHYLNGKFVFIAYSSMGENDDENYTHVTHWMPLPAPPQGDTP